MEALSDYPIGVMVTDTAVSETEIEALTKTLKLHVPELVTVIASDRSDAQSLIALINEGQIFRFLLKPISKGQCRLWLDSAVRKYSDLVTNSGAAVRHRVARQAETDTSVASPVLSLLKSGIARIRARIHRGD
jgi:DNA-binding NtrC family response regulator